MLTHRMLPPPDATQGINPCAANGRLYKAAPGSYLDVPDFDAQVLAANGWTLATNGGSGPSAARPVAPVKGTAYHDASLGYTVIWDGKTWRNPANATAV